METTSWNQLAILLINSPCNIYQSEQIAYAANDITLFIHGNKVSTNEPIEIVDGKTLVPLRIIAEHLDQEVHWDATTKTVTIEKKPVSGLEKMLVQRGNDSFDTEAFDSSEQAFIHHLMTLYNAAYRGLLTELESDTDILTSDKLDFLKGNDESKENKLPASHRHVRLVKEAYVPQAGENAPPAKDILFFVNEEEQDYLQIGVQNPSDLNEWKIFKVKDYGNWFEKEMDLYIRSTSGL